MGLPALKPDVFRDQSGKEWTKPADVPAEWRPSAYAAVRKNGQVLMVKTNGSGNVWEFPGGGVHPGESFPDAVGREVKEETGYQVHLSPDPVPFYVGQDQFYYLKRQRYCYGVLLVYEAEYVARISDLPRGVTVPPGQDEIIAVDWLHLRDLDIRNTNSIHFPAVRLLQRR